MESRFSDKRFRLLEKIYQWFDEIAWSYESWSCEPDCDTCCTSSVILTTLEAAYLWEKGLNFLQGKTTLDFPGVSLPPINMTTNERAELCLAQKDFEEDAPPLAPAACPLLTDHQCPCYEIRPLMCRLMFSTVRCKEDGAAEMPNQLLSLTTACLQIIEDLDHGGWSGYLAHVLPLFGDVEFADSYRRGVLKTNDKNLRHNRSNPGFLIPPEDRGQVQVWLKKLDESLRGE